MLAVGVSVQIPQGLSSLQCDRLPVSQCADEPTVSGVLELVLGAEVNLPRAGPRASQRIQQGVRIVGWLV